MSIFRKRKPDSNISDLGFDEALARFIQTDNKELADAKDRIDKDEEEVRQYVKERRESIGKGARRTGSRFRL
jgi:hypothetical protein